jgi:cytidine deaminase
VRRGNTLTVRQVPGNALQWNASGHGPLTAKGRNPVLESELVQIATALAGEFRTSDHCAAGGVAAALVTRAGNVYTGVCVDTDCGLGFCAEHAAIAEMLKARESEIALIVAVRGGDIVAPCGRCRELMWQVSPRGAATRVILGPGTTRPLSELLPHRED